MIEVPAGSYAGWFGITTSGTAAAPITLLAAPGAVLSGTTRVDISGSYINLIGFGVTSTAPGIITVSGSARNIRLDRMAFTGAGDTQSGSSVGLIRVNAAPGWSSDVTATKPPAPPIVRNVIVTRSSFDQVRNTVLWVNHGVQGTEFCHNTITGPHGIAGSETMAIKIGYGWGNNEASATRIAFNTIRNWSGEPYVIGIKMGGAEIIGNVIDRGRIELRNTNNTRLVGNVLGNGGILAGGSNNVITDNHVTATTNGFGPFVMYTTNGNDYGGSPWYYTALTASRFERNTLIVTPGSNAWSIMHVAVFRPGYLSPPQGNVFAGNTMVSQNGQCLTVSDPGTPTAASVVAVNTWSGNSLYCSTGTPTPAIPGTTVLGAAPSLTAPASLVLTAAQIG